VSKQKAKVPSLETNGIADAEMKYVPEVAMVLVCATTPAVSDKGISEPGATRAE